MSATPTDQRVPLVEARALADDLVGLLEPFAERIEVAGSVRRERPDVGDLELVAIPRFRPGAQATLFGPGDPVNELWEGLEAAIRREATPCPDCRSDEGMLGRMRRVLEGGDPACPRCRNAGLVGRLTVAPPYLVDCTACRAEGCERCHAYGKVWRAAPWGDRYRKVVYRGIGVDLFTATPSTWGAIMLIRTGPPAYSQEWVTALRRHGLVQRDGLVELVSQGRQVQVPDEATAHRLVGWNVIAPRRRDELVDRPRWAEHPRLIGR